MTHAMIHACVALKNRGEHLLRALPTWRAWHDTSGPAHLVVADFRSDDLNLVAVLDAASIPSLLVGCAGYFSRTGGLLAAAQMSGARAQDILFFLDADVLVTDPRFGDTLRDRVRPGQAYLPTVYGLNQNRPAVIDGNAEGDRVDPETGRRANGYWRDRGFGMVGITRADYDCTGGWDRNLRRWGGEDDDFARRCRVAGLRIVRERCPALLHQWHPDSMDYRERYMDPSAPRVSVLPFKSPAQAGS